MKSLLIMVESRRRGLGPPTEATVSASSKTVRVHRFITFDTFKDRINDLTHTKRTLADLTVGTGEKWSGNLGKAALKIPLYLGQITFRYSS